MLVNQIKTVLDIFRKYDVGYTPLLIGAHGIGKTESVRAYAAANDLPFKLVQLGQMSDAGDLIGLQYIEKGKSRFTLPAFFPTEENTVLLIDEINRATKDMLQAVFQLISRDKEYNGYKLPKGTLVVAAMNPDVDGYDVTSFEDHAFNDRFCHIKVESSSDAWLDYAASAGVHGGVSGFIQANRAALMHEPPAFSISNVTPTPRAWEAIGRGLADAYVSGDSKDKTLLCEVIAGLVGIETSVAFTKYLDEKYVTIGAEDLLNNYEKYSERVKAYGSPAEGRMDLLEHINDGIRALITKRVPTSKEVSGLYAYMLDLPTDMALAFLCNSGDKGLLMHEKLAIDFAIENGGKHEWFEAKELIKKLEAGNAR